MFGKKNPSDTSLTYHLSNNKVLNFSIRKFLLNFSMSRFYLWKIEYFFLIIFLF
jgi:hypothetical protein